MFVNLTSLSSSSLALLVSPCIYVTFASVSIEMADHIHQTKHAKHSFAMQVWEKFFMNPNSGLKCFEYVNRYDLKLHKTTYKTVTCNLNVKFWRFLRKVCAVCSFSQVWTKLWTLTKSCQNEREKLQCTKWIKIRKYNLDMY